MSDDRLRRARERAGITQAGLATRAGVSRQLIGSAEAGRHVPAVDTALRIARALGETVESLFGEGPAPGPGLPAGGVREGTPVVVARVGGGLQAHPLPSVAAGDGAWAAADGVVEDGAVRLLPGTDTSALVVVGCDPVLGLCAALLARAGSRRVAAVEGTSGAAVAALSAGRAHAALVHGPGDGLPAAPAGTLRVHLARWRVGVGVHRDRRAADSLDALLNGGVPVVQRDPGAASQQALLRAAGERVPAPAARASGHLDAARRAALTGGAAVTFEPAARLHDLRFIPLETHAVELWIGARHTEHPGAEALVRLLGSTALRRRIDAVGGYDLEGCGALVPAG